MGCSLLRAEPSYLRFPSDIHWKTQASAHFEIIYRENQKKFAERTLQAAERAHRLLQPIFPEVPPLTRIVLADFSDSLNGYSLNFPYPHFVVFASPPESTSELSSLDQWLDSVVLHEFAHTLHLYPAHGIWKLMRSVFGTWVVPNGMLPQHFHEGLATFLETEFSKGGRGRSAYFKMLTRKSVQSGQWLEDFAPLDRRDGSFSFFPQGSSPYFFGYHFYDFLWRQKGAEGIRDLTLASSSNWPYWVGTPIEDVYGLSISEIWARIKQEQTQLFQKELTHLKSQSPSALTYFTRSGFLKKEVRSSVQLKEVAYLSSHPQDGQRLEILETSQGNKVFSHPIPVSGAGGLCWKRNERESVFVAPVIWSEDNYQETRLQVISALPKQSRGYLSTPSEPIRNVHEFSCSEDFSQLLTYQEKGGKGSLRVYQGNFNQSETALKLNHQWELPEGTWVSSLLIGNPHIFLLRKGDKSLFFEWQPPELPKPLGEIPGHAFSLKKNSNGIFLITSLSGREEIWQWDRLSGTLKKQVIVTGGVNSFDFAPEGFYVTSYEPGGYDIALVGLPQSGKTRLSPVSLEDSKPLASESISPEKDYSPLSTLIPRTWVPSALIVPYGLQLGAWIPMFDLSQRHFYDVNLGLDQRDTNEGKKVLPYFSALYGYRFGTSQVLNASGYYVPTFLIFSQSFFERWGTSLSWGRRIPGTAIHTRFSSLFRRVENSSLGPSNRSVGLGIDLGWSNQNTTDVFENEIQTGVRLTGTHQWFLKPLGSQDGFFSTLFSAEGFLNPPFWTSSTFYLALRQGYTEGTPLYNSFFEGGGELMFTQTRGFFLNRGYLPGSFAARRIFGGNLEFRFPIARVERGYQLLPIFLNALSGALVLDTTSYDRGLNHSYPKRWLKEFLWSAGVELKTQWRFFYYLPTEVRLGFYRGLSREGEPFYFSLGVQASL